MFALVSPLVFQVVIDKVLVHRSLSTLDVLAFALAGIAAFETILGILRTYLFAHTTNRIDVELGARLFRHLLALPLAYFQARRVGDSVARVRELENIRNFLTSSALTLVIDLFLCVGVSGGDVPLLAAATGIVIASFRSTSPYRPARRRCTSAASTRNSRAAPRTRRSWWKRDRRRDPQGDGWSSRRCSGAGKSSSRVRGVELPGAEARQQRQHAVQFVSKLVTAATLYFGAKLVIDGSLTVGELVAFNILARASERTGAAARRDLAGFPPGAGCQSRGWATSSTRRPRTTMNPARAALPAISRRNRLRARQFPLSHRWAEVLHDVSFKIEPGQLVGIVGRRARARARSPSWVQRLYVPEGGRVLIDGIDLSMIDNLVAAPADRRRAAGEHAVQLFGAREHRTRRSPRCRWSG